MYKLFEQLKKGISSKDTSFSQFISRFQGMLFGV